MNKKEMLEKSRAKNWNSLNDVEVAKEAILTNYSIHGDFSPTDLSKYYQGAFACLDFGCGVGRNFPLLNEKCKEVHAFDLPNMLKLMTKEDRESVKSVGDDWDTLKKINGFDVIHACLVLQHIDETYLREYLKDFVKMSDRLVLASRSYLDDDGKNVMKILLEYYDVVELTDTVEHCLTATPEEHLHFQGLFKKK